VIDVVPYLYLLALVISILGLGLLDFRHELAIKRYPLPTLISVAAGVVVFLVWDLIGIYFGIFFRGDASHLTGITIAPELPLEEVFFLILLSYNALLAYQFFAKRVKK
jgi:lycopene cyclase domain-containing protein